MIRERERDIMLYSVIIFIIWLLLLIIATIIPSVVTLILIIKAIDNAMELYHKIKNNKIK